MKGLKFPENKLFCVRGPYPWTIYNPPAAAASTTKSELCRHWIIFFLLSLLAPFEKNQIQIPLKTTIITLIVRKGIGGEKKAKNSKTKIAADN